MSAIEAFVNAAIGIVVSWTLTLTVLGYTAAQSIGVTAMFFAASFTRAYVIRVVFKAWQS